MTVAVVTDSSAALPAELAEREHVDVVPLCVVVDGTTYKEGLDITAERISGALRKGVPVSTSRPSPEAFVAAFDRLAAQGIEQIVSVHLSEELSGTVGSARLAAARVGVDVTVLDSRSIGMAVGFAALAGARVAAAAGGVDEVVAAIRGSVERSHTWASVDDLTHLRRGGRIGKATAFLGSALAIKPMLQVINGTVEPLARVRTTGKAMAKLAALASEAAAELGGQVEISVQHLDARDRAEALLETLGESIDNARQVWLVELGAALGAHVGPGTVGVSVSPRD